MIRRCDDCGTVYDDVERWTLCPHGPLGGGNSTYCRIHDLDPCPFCNPAAKNPLVSFSPRLHCSLRGRVELRHDLDAGFPTVDP